MEKTKRKNLLLQTGLGYLLTLLLEEKEVKI
jgi:hypothetical protein